MNDMFNLVVIRLEAVAAALSADCQHYLYHHNNIIINILNSILMMMMMIPACVSPLDVGSNIGGHGSSKGGGGPGATSGQNEKTLAKIELKIQ